MERSITMNMRGNGELASWNDGAARSAILQFVARVTTPSSPAFVPPEARVAVFDNDGTLWCEKPMPIELGFILGRLAEMAADDPALRTQQPWKAAYEKDYGWLGGAITKHYAGNDDDVKVLLGAILRAFEGMSVETYEAAAREYVWRTPHPTLKRKMGDCAYRPMIELLRHLDRHGFQTFIASGGDRDFMRPVTGEIYGVPPERVIGSSSSLRYREDDGSGEIVYLAQPDVFDDGAVKPVRIWSRIGRRPILTVGNSNGDIPMLEFTGGEGLPALRMLVLHDDPERELDYTAGAERALELAGKSHWTLISIKNDWSAVFDAH